MNIKKFFLITFFSVSACFIFAETLPFVTFSLGLSTGHIFYGSGEYEIPSTPTDAPELPPESEPNNDSPDEPELPDNSEPETPPVEEPLTTLKNSQSIPLRLEDGNEVLIGFGGNLSFNFSDSFSLYTDADVMANFNWQDKNYSHHLDYSFSTGIKLSPFYAIPGLTISLGYLLGDRIDFYKAEGKDLYVNKTAWGNGLKASVEYNFYRDTGTIFLPTIGCSWRYIPRGNNASDNIIQCYILVNF